MKIYFWKIKKDNIRTNDGSSNDADISNIPKNLVKWFAQNVCVDHEKVFSIPIGLENSKWFTNLNKKEKIIKKQIEKKEYKNLLYICHNIQTNISERKEPYEIFKDKTWTTLEYGFNGNNFDSYLNKYLIVQTLLLFPNFFEIKYHHTERHFFQFLYL